MPQNQDVPDLPDGVRFGRSGLDGAPPPLPKRWLVLGGGLAATVIAAAIIVGTGDFSLEAGVDPDRAEPTATFVETEPVGISPLTRATGACLGTIRDERSADSTGGLGMLPASLDLSVAYQHQVAGRAAVAVTDGGRSALCVSGPEGLSSTSYDAGDAPNPLLQYVRTPPWPAEAIVQVLAGEVADDVDVVEILLDGEPVGQADVADGYFSAFVEAPPGEELTYAVTSANGGTEVVSADEPAASQNVGGSNAAARACLSYLNITVAEPEPYGNRAPSVFDVAYDLIAEHTQTDYVLAAADDGTTITACLEAPGITWTASQAPELPAGELITPLEPTTRSSGSDLYPLVGRVADSVTAVEIVTADGQRLPAHLEDGFYAVLLPAADSVDVTYDVQTDDGR